MFRLTELVAYMIRQLCSYLVQDSQLQRQWKAVFAVGFFTLFPLLLAVDLYIDDIERAMNGKLTWVRVGRPLADVLVGWLNFGRPATAASPLYTLVAIAILSLVGVACARAYGIRSPFWTAIASLPLMAQPYALQAMSYGFDALFMAVALASAITAAILVHRSKSWRIIAVALALLLVSFNLYQPAANGFLVLTGCFCVASSIGVLDRHWQVLSLQWRLLISAVIYAGGYGLYRLVGALFFEQRLNGYAAGAAELKQFDSALALKLFISACEPLQMLAKDFSSLPVLLPFVLFFVSYAALLIQWRSLPVAVSTLAGLLMVVVLAPGGMLLLRESFVRHPRVMLYFGPFLTSLILQFLTLSERLKRPIWRFAVLPLIWLIVVMSYAYGHSFAAQARFEQGRISRIVGAASFLQAKFSDQTLRFLMVEGTMPRSPVLQNTVRKFPLIDRLIPPFLDGNKTFSFSQLQLHGLHLKKRKLDDAENYFSPSCQFLSDSICTSEFSLRKVAPDTLYLELAPDPASIRPST